MKLWAVLFLLIAVLASTAGAGTRPSLRVAATNPVTIVGTGFKAGERVRVTVSTAGERATRLTVASARGWFRVRFAGIRAASECKVFAVATGSNGSRAVWKPTWMPCGAELVPVER